MPNMKSWIKIVTVLCGAVVLFACSNGASTGQIVDSTGKHPANWLENHWVVYNSTTPAEDVTKSPCAECHGSDLSGGIAKVSCFSAQAQDGRQCHATTLGHPANWVNALQHGKTGAMAAPGTSSGFAYCTKCHGNDYKGGTGKAVSCFSCHTTAPHPPKPWIGGTLSHITTSPANVTVCFQCHANGNNFGPVIVSTPSSTSPSAPTPDCFNNTLCHGGDVNPPHAISAAYLAPSQHGIDAAGKNTTKPELSLASCKSCHAGATARFNIPTNNMANGCETCHDENTAHPIPWLPGRIGTPFNIANTTTHASVSVGIMTTACTICHITNGTIGATTGPPCMSCHTASSPVTTPTGCTSCHADFVKQQPVSGAHATHLALPNVTCLVCHFGAGATGNRAIGTAKHANGTLDISLLDVDPASNSFKAKTGNFSLNPVDKTCSNVRCHGGKTTPDWTTGVLSVSTDCLKCHQQGDAGNAPQTPQFNSFFSGSFGGLNLHQFHLLQTNPGTTRLVFCTDCHNIVKLTSQHFDGLATSAFTAPGNTISGGTTRITSYDTTVQRCSGVTCHTFAPLSPLWIQ